MVLIPKEIIRPAVYWYTDQESGMPRKLDVTPATVKYYFDQGKAMRAAGLSIPVPYEHQPDAKPLTPAEKAAHQLQNNSGWVEDYELRKVKDDDGKEVEALFGMVDVTDPDVAKKLPHTIRWSSPHISSFTDGNGKKWDGVISHLALTTRPRIIKQQPFPTISAAMSLAATLPLTPFDSKTSVPPKGLSLSRAVALKEVSGQWLPRYPMAFSLMTGALLAETEVKEKPPAKGPPKKEGGGEKPLEKKEGPPEKGKEGPPEKSVEGGEKPPVPGAADPAAGGAPQVDPETGMPIEKSLVDPDGDISVWEVICDLLAGEGYDFPEGTTGENFPERAYKMLMGKLKEKSVMPEPPGMGNQPPPTKPPGNDLPRNPKVPETVEQRPALYMSLEQAQAIQDPTMRSMALSLVENQQLTAALRNNAIEAAKAKRQQRIEAVCKRVKDPAFRDELVAQAASAQFSLGADGVVKDSMQGVLDLLDKGVRNIPSLLTTPSALLQEVPHPRDENGEMSEERRQAVVKEFTKNGNIPDHPVAR